MATNHKLKLTGLCFQYYSYFPTPSSCDPRHRLLPEGTGRWHTPTPQHPSDTGGAPQFGSNSLFSYCSPARTIFHQERDPCARQEATLPLLGFPNHSTATAPALILHQQIRRRLQLVQNPIILPPPNPASLLQSFCYTCKGIRGNTTFPALPSQVYLKGVYLVHNKNN